MYVLEEPVHEVGECGPGYFLGHVVRDVAVSRGDVSHGLALAGHLHRFADHQFLHHLNPVRNVNIEALSAVFLRIDQSPHVDTLVSALLEPVEVDEKERQSCQTLLAIYNEPLSTLVADDDGAEEVVAIALNFVRRMTRFVRVKKLARQVVEQLANLALLPCILSLVEVDGILGFVE